MENVNVPTCGTLALQDHKRCNTIIYPNHRLGPHQNLASHRLNHADRLSRPCLSSQVFAIFQSKQMLPHCGYLQETSGHRIFVWAYHFLKQAQVIKNMHTLENI